jgi:hypothetical protein
MEMRAHCFFDADEKGRDHLNVGHVLTGVLIPRLGGEQPGQALRKI